MTNYNELKTSFLIADLAGYTSLTETHGNVSAVNLVTRYIEIVQKSLKGDSFLQERVGDEVLIISNNVYNLLDTAIDLVHNIEQEPQFLSVHIGIHTGNVIKQDGNYFGSALNICSRISAYSRGGQILCSADVVKEMSDISSYQFIKVGDIRFKNVPEPVIIYELVLDFPKSNIEVDPVCKMQIDILNSSAKLPYNDKTHHFCSFKCLEIFIKNPSYFT